MSNTPDPPRQAWTGRNGIPNAQTSYATALGMGLPQSFTGVMPGLPAGHPNHPQSDIFDSGSSGYSNNHNFTTPVNSTTWHESDPTDTSMSMGQAGMST